MKKLGRGWQYTTYDLGNGRVFKKYNSKFVGYLHILKDCFPFIDNPLWELPGYYRGCKATAIDSLKKLANPVLESWMMGNPNVLNELDYEQDKLTPLHDILSVSDDENTKNIINKFVEFNEMMVEKSIIDKSFHICKNFALDTQGRVVIMDLGELYTSKAAIEKQIKNRAWAKEYVVHPLPKNLRTYFIEQMDAAFSEKALQ